MTSKEIISLRLSNQWITPSQLPSQVSPPDLRLTPAPDPRLIPPQASPSTPADVVAHLGALQAQDYAMVKWAIGLRLGSTTHDEIEQAIDKGQILRTHVLRPTWHLVHPKDLRWMLALSAPRIRAAMASQERQLGLDEKILHHSEKIIEKALLKDKHLTRAGLMAQLEAAGIATNDVRSSHIMIRAELNGLVCSGPRQGKQSTYALLEDRVPPAPKLSRDESIAQLALRYFTSHGPATVHDFAWWSGLSVTDAKKGIESSGAEWHRITPSLLLASPAQSFPPAHAVQIPPSPRSQSAFLLPAFDELIISYADRSALLDPVTEKKVVTNNGLFYPTILVNGKIAGTWTRTEKSHKITISHNLIRPVSKSAEKAIATASRKYSKFMGKQR